MARMRAAGVPLLMAVMVAVCIGVKDKMPSQIIRYNGISLYWIRCIREILQEG